MNPCSLVRPFAIVLPGLLVVLGATLTLGAARPRQDDAAMQELLAQAQPGPEHQRLQALAGDWEVSFDGANPGAPPDTGKGSAATILDGRFLVVDYSLGAAGDYRYTIGFDRRHGEYSMVVMDTHGTYFVTARGAEKEGRILMAGTDDDPYMEKLGFTKKFVFELTIESENAFFVSTYFVDTRTEEEPLMLVGVCRFQR